MGRERLEFGIRVWKFMVKSVKTCYRSVWNHPLLVCFVCFIIYLYRSVPFMFSILVTASPVLVCTAVLLGILLSFGSPNIPEIEEKEEKVTREVSPLKTGATEDDTGVKKHVGKMKGIVENDYENVSLVDDEVSEVEEDDGPVSYKLLVDERIDEVQGTSNDLLLENKREIQGDVPKGYEYLDSSSDGAESTSHEATIADVIPVLDELHPLLGSDASQPALFSVNGSEAVSERSRCSSNDGEEDDDEGKGAKTDNEDESKSAIKWTEDDQKNLIDLGTSELERNQRLETLIAKRMAHKNMRPMTEKNPMEIDNAVASSRVTPISTARRNPFELPYDPWHELGLPPIPGSAPPILRPRNPFDLHFDPSEEKTDPKGDSLHDGFSGFNQREMVPQRDSIFRRHGSFNVGPPSFGELKWKPYFVPEQLVTEGASLQRHLSEASESKMSSVPDTDSMSSVPDEDNKPNEHGVSRETRQIANDQERQSSGDVESINAVLAKNRDVHRDVVEITLGDGENQMEMESNLSEAAATAHMEFNAGEIHSRRELATEYSSSSSSSTSSSSSSSETDEEVSDVKEEHFASSEAIDHETEESGFSTQPSFEESEFHSTSRVVDDDQHREPVYDSSPPSFEKFLSFSSVSSNTLAEIAEMSLPFMLLDPTDERPKGSGETTEQSTTSFEEMHPVSSESSYQDVPYTGGSSPESDKQLSWYDTNMDEHDKFEEIGSPEGSHVAYSERAFLPKDTKTDTNVVLPVLEARSAEDIDLAFKQLHEGVSVEEVIVPSMIEKPQDNADNKTQLPVVEARSLEDIHRAFQQVPESNQAERPQSSGLRNESSEDSKTETKVVLPVLEARSAEDIDLAFKQLHEGVDVEDVIVPSMIEKPQDHGDITSKLPVVEARSLEDIHKAFQHVPQSSGVRNESPKEMKTETNAVLPVLEARSAEDIDLAFKQLHEGVDVEEVIVPSMIEKQQDNADNKSKLPVVEARSLEDLRNVFQQDPGSNGAKLSHSSGVKDESSSTSEGHEVVSAKQNDVSDGKSASGSESEYDSADYE